MKKLFVLLASVLACGWAVAQSPASAPGAGRGNAAAFQSRKAEVANALAQASTCVNSAADPKAMRECLRTLHETLRSDLGRPGKN